MTDNEYGDWHAIQLEKLNRLIDKLKAKAEQDGKPSTFANIRALERERRKIQDKKDYANKTKSDKDGPDQGLLLQR